MKIGLLGGSFNPPHQGHIHISNQAIKHLNLHQLWWIPTTQNPLKTLKTSQNYQQRLKECQKLTKNHPKIKIKPLKNNIYTHKMLTKLQNQHKRDQFYWIMGADNLKTFHKWQNFRKILTQTPIIIFNRQNHLKNPSQYKSLQIGRHLYKSSLKLIKTKNFDLSSTEIR